MSKLFSVCKDDLRIETFCGHGPGGQHRNKNQTAVRITHVASGLAAESQEFKSQRQNRRAAFQKLAKKLVAWFLQQAGPAPSRERITDVIRTYHEPDNRVVDKASGLQQPYRVVLEDPSAMIAARKARKTE